MRFHVKIKGVKPIIIQSDRMADPLDPAAKELSLLTRRSAKTDKKSEKVQQEISRIEWFGALYCDDDGIPKIALPGDNVMRALRDAAAQERQGETVRREVTIEEDLIPIKHTGPKDLEKMFQDGRFVFRKTVVIGKARTPRTRPRLPPDWEMEFTAEIGGAATLTGDDLKRFLVNAGRVGLGTWRPRYGHFTVEAFKKV